MRVIVFLAIILFTTKLMGILMRKIGLPQVAGMVIAGLLIGPAIFSQINLIPGFNGIIDPTSTEMSILGTFSQVGVILILFSSGLETDVKELKKSGVAATLVACMGVLVPLVLGTVLAMLFMCGFDGFFAGFANHGYLMNALFVGCILTATSVGITVETLRELGQLKTKIGTTLVSAAIIDDVIGILVLSIVTSLNGKGNIGITILKAVGFFVFTIGIGFIFRIIYKHVELKHPHTRRLGIYALAMCFLFAYAAETFFGIAAITGAYMAGVMLSGLGDSDYVDKKVILSGYLIFTPIFFAYIGISADFSQFKPTDLLFGLAFVVVGIAGKILGSGGIARIKGFDTRDSLMIGSGMIARGEVALAVYSTGSALMYKAGDGTLLGINPLVGTIMLILTTSVLCPILLKVIGKSKEKQLNANVGKEPNTSIGNEQNAISEATTAAPTEAK